MKKNKALLLFSENCIDLVQLLCNYWVIIVIIYGNFLLTCIDVARMKCKI